MQLLHKTFSWLIQDDGSIPTGIQHISRGKNGLRLANLGSLDTDESSVLLLPSQFSSAITKIRLWVAQTLAVYRGSDVIPVITVKSESHMTKIE